MDAPARIRPLPDAHPVRARAPQDVPLIDGTEDVCGFCGQEWRRDLLFHGLGPCCHDEYDAVAS